MKRMKGVQAKLPKPTNALLGTAGDARDDNSVALVDSNGKDGDTGLGNSAANDGGNGGSGIS